jgi:phosphonate transport system substrate-binding protein
VVQIWKSKPIPEGPIVLRKALPSDTKVKMTALMASLPAIDPDCAYGVLSGEAKGLQPITHSAYEAIIEARKLKSN